MAQDGDGLNSPFAESLLHDDVKARTSGQQEPFTYGALPAEALFFKATSQ